jgi:hypothetical protein
MKNLNVGTIIEYNNVNGIWIESIIYKTTESYIWFKGSGFNRIAKITFHKYPTLYRIKN